MNRIQLKRTAGWRMPENTIKVDRTSKWGNPYKVKPTIQSNERGWFVHCEGVIPSYFHRYEDAVSYSIKSYKVYLQKMVQSGRLDLSELEGKNLACWCSLNGKCHADILITAVQTRGASLLDN